MNVDQKSSHLRRGSGAGSRFAAAIVGAMIALLTGCTCSTQPTGTGSDGSTNTDEAAVVQAPGVAVDVAPTPEPLSGTVNLAIWSNYVTNETLASFTTATGVTVNVSNYSSNEELLAKLQAGGTGIDVAVPSDYMVQIMQNLQLIEVLDRTQISNVAGLDPTKMGKPFDPENRWSVPYGWTVTGIGINRDVYKGPLASWKDLLTLPELNGKVSLLDDAREALGAALRTVGHGINTVDPAQLEMGRKALADARGQIRAFTSEPRDLLVRGELAAAQIYSSDALQARRETGGRIEFVVPQEGGTMAIDNLVIPRGAPNPRAAHALINHLISAESNVTYVTSILAGPVVLKTMELLTPELRDNRGLFPPAEIMAKCEMVTDIGEATKLWDRAWTEVKARGGRR